MFVTTVDVVAIGHTGGAPYALRDLLAGYGADVRLLPVGSPRHLADVLNGTLSQAEHLVFSCHGDSRGMVLDRLAPELTEQQPFNDVLTPAIVAELSCSPRSAVLSTGCATGTDALARAFLGGGCSAYVAPLRYPAGAAVLAFTSAFYYQVLVLGFSLPEAVASARGLGGDTELFRLWT
ncbi:CHAT domain-containing protein [Streptomyces sp. AA1529]|uniref:CHAT domain-containing protein n=1 Tax=Streptomyces sp. AA1529 TaxID=1203257 RepID=UPI000367DF22